MHQPSIPALLRSNRSFRSFWAGQTISLFGDQISLLALPLLAALELDAGPAQMGLLSSVGLAPYLLFAVHLGAWADRMPSRRALLVGADVGRAALLATIPVAAALDGLTMVQLYVVAFATGSLTVLFGVAYNAVFVSLVGREEYIEASSLLNGSRALAMAGGSSVAGVLVQLLSAPVALLVDGTSYISSALFVGRSQTVEAPVGAGGEGGGLSAGARFVARTPLMRSSLLAAATLNLFNSAFYALFVLYATRSLGIGAAALGIALGIGALGSVLGTVVAGGLSRRLGIGRSVVLAFVAAPLPLILVPLAAGSSPAEALVLLGIAEFISGLGVMVLDVGLGAVQTALVPDALRARAAGAYLLVNYGVRAVGALGGGLLAAAIGLQTTMWIAALGAVAGVLWLLPSPMPRLVRLPEPVADS